MLPQKNNKPKRPSGQRTNLIALSLVIGIVAIPLVAIATRYSGRIVIEAGKGGGKVSVESFQPITLPPTNDR